MELVSLVHLLSSHTLAEQRDVKCDHRSIPSPFFAPLSLLLSLCLSLSPSLRLSLCLSLPSSLSPSLLVYYHPLTEIVKLVMQNIFLEPRFWALSHPELVFNMCACYFVVVFCDQVGTGIPEHVV